MLSRPRARSRETPRAHNAIPPDQVLDAAHAIVCERGIRGLTMADLARQAQVSRATLYRTWPNVEGVVADLFTREFRGLVTAAMRTLDGESVREVLVGLTVTMVAAARDLPLLQRVVEMDPEFLATYLLYRRGRSTEEQIRLLEDLIRDGQAEGSVRPGDATILASAVLLNAWGFVLTGPAFVGDDELDELDDVLGDLLEAFLRP